MDATDKRQSTYEYAVEVPAGSPQATACAFLWDVQLHRQDGREGH